MAKCDFSPISSTTIRPILSFVIVTLILYAVLHWLLSFLNSSLGDPEPDEQVKKGKLDMLYKTDPVDNEPLSESLSSMTKKSVEPFRPNKKRKAWLT